MWYIIFESNKQLQSNLQNRQLTRMSAIHQLDILMWMPIIYTATTFVLCLYNSIDVQEQDDTKMYK